MFGQAITGKVVDPARIAWKQWLELDDAQQRRDYQMYRDFYDGKHGVKLTDRQALYLQAETGMDFRLNYLALAVDMMAQRFNVTSFDAPGEYGGKDGKLMEWWQKNRMDATQYHVINQTCVDGDTFVLVGWDNAKGQPIVSHERAYDGYEGMSVIYSSSTSRKVAMAAKRWREIDPYTLDPFMRMNIYTPTQILRYASAGSLGADWQPYEGDGPAIEPWPVGVVPVVHFRFKDNGTNWGMSMMDDLIPPQMALNKATIDVIEAADKTAFQIVTLKGGEPEIAPIGPGVILYNVNDTAAWGYIPPADLDKLVALKNEFVATIAQLSQIPLNYFQVTGQVAAADTQEADDSGLAEKVESYSRSFGNGWEDVMALAAAESAAFGSGTAVDVEDISTVWGPFNRVNKLRVKQTKAEIVQVLTNAGGSFEGAVQVAEFDEGDVDAMLRLDYEVQQ